MGLRSNWCERRRKPLRHFEPGRVWTPQRRASRIDAVNVEENERTGFKHSGWAAVNGAP